MFFADWSEDDTLCSRVPLGTCFSVARPWLAEFFKHRFKGRGTFFVDFYRIKGGHDVMTRDAQRVWSIYVEVSLTQFPAPNNQLQVQWSPMYLLIGSDLSQHSGSTFHPDWSCVIPLIPWVPVSSHFHHNYLYTFPGHRSLTTVIRRTSRDRETSKDGTGLVLALKSANGPSPGTQRLAATGHYKNVNYFSNNSDFNRPQHVFPKGCRCVSIMLCSASIDPDKSLSTLQDWSQRGYRAI